MRGCLFNPRKKEVILMRGKTTRSRYTGIAILIVAIAKAVAMIIAALHK